MIASLAIEGVGQQAEAVDFTPTFTVVLYLAVCAARHRHGYHVAIIAGDACSASNVSVGRIPYSGTPCHERCGQHDQQGLEGGHASRGGHTPAWSMTAPK